MLESLLWPGVTGTLSSTIKDSILYQPFLKPIVLMRSGLLVTARELGSWQEGSELQETWGRKWVGKVVQSWRYRQRSSTEDELHLIHRWCGLTPMTGWGMDVWLRVERENVHYLDNYHGISVLNNSKSTMHRGDVLGVPLNKTQCEECSLELHDRVALKCHTPQHAPPPLCKISAPRWKRIDLSQCFSAGISSNTQGTFSYHNWAKEGVATCISQVEVNDVAKHPTKHRAHIYHRLIPLFDVCWQLLSTSPVCPTSGQADKKPWCSVLWLDWKSQVHKLLTAWGNIRPPQRHHRDPTLVSIFCFCKPCSIQKASRKCTFEKHATGRDHFLKAKNVHIASSLRLFSPQTHTKLFISKER